MKLYDVVIIGGGITGLSAAYYIQNRMKQFSNPLHFTVIEASDCLGGKIQTYKHDDYIIEKGPDSFLKRKESTIELVKELGLEHELIQNETSTSFILKNDRLYSIPEDAMMGVPTRVAPFMKTRLISLKGKARAAYDLFLPRSKRETDQSVGHFFKRRLGKELVDSLIDPLLSGIYASNIDDLSLKATFPHFQQLEEKHRSLILGMRTMRTKLPEKKEGQFLTLKSGLHTLIKKLEKEIGSQHIKMSISVQAMKKVMGGYLLTLSNGEKLQASHVIFTCPVQTVGRVLKQYDFSRQLSVKTSTTVANIALAFSASQLHITQQGTGFVVPKNAGYTITACTWTNKKWPHTTPPGKVLLRCFIGKPEQEQIVQQTDADILEIVLKDLRRVMVINGEPEFYHLTRWPNAMPQYHVGQQEWLEQLRKNIQFHLPNIHLAGASYEGIGVGDCINQGKTSAEAVIAGMMDREQTGV